MFLKMQHVNNQRIINPLQNNSHMINPLIHFISKISPKSAMIKISRIGSIWGEGRKDDSLLGRKV